MSTKPTTSAYTETPPWGGTAGLSSASQLVGGTGDILVVSDDVTGAGSISLVSAEPIEVGFTD